MKTPSPRQKQQGNVLLICLILGLVIGIALAATLMMVQGQEQNVARAQSWSQSLVVAEAGIEDAMSLLNKSSTWSNSASADNYSAAGNVYHVRRYIAVNTLTNYYDVYVTNVNNAPVIKSTGTAVWNDPDGATYGILRAVLVTTANTGPYPYAVLAQNNINLSGGPTVDSFPGGHYVPGNVRDNAIIATDETNTAGAVTVKGNSDVYGHVYTGGGSTVAVNGNVSIGSTNWVPTAGVQSNWTANTMNSYIPNAPTAPSASYFSLPSATNGVYTLSASGPGTTKYYTVPDGFTLTGGNGIVITNGAVVIDFAGSFKISGNNSSVNIATNASLVGYLNGSITLGGGGAVNLSAYATNCVLYGSTNCTSVTIGGSSSFVGVVNAPQADLTLNGGSAYIGAAIVNSLKDGGGAAIHYDESLGNIGYQVTMTSWAEVTP